MRRGFTLPELVVALAVISVAIMVLWPTCIGSSRHNARRSACQSNLKQMALAFEQYAQDYDKWFPIIQSSATVGWADLLQPYAKSWSIFQCPENAKSRDDNLTDYFYNGRLSELEIKKVRIPSATILAGDGNFEAPTNAAIYSVPKAWLKDENSPAFRHLSFTNTLFVDGHVKIVKARNIAAKSPISNGPTFYPQ